MISKVLELSEVRKSFDGGKVKVLNDISFAVKEGEFVAIEGKSGAGKSTLLKVIAGFLSIDGGRIERKYNGNCGFIFQDFFMDESLNVAENIMLPGMIAGMSKRSREARLGELLKGDSGDIGGILLRKTNSISGGQLQRVAIMRAIFCAPKLILADEATSNLDDENAVLFLTTLRKLCDNGMSLIIATHDARVKSFADRIIKIENGRI